MFREQSRIPRFHLLFYEAKNRQFGAFFLNSYKQLEVDLFSSTACEHKSTICDDNERMSAIPGAMQARLHLYSSALLGRT
jgi:hypothetical protein